jgi:hypothetical protein
MAIPRTLNARSVQKLSIQIKEHARNAELAKDY